MWPIKEKYLEEQDNQKQGRISREVEMDVFALLQLCWLPHVDACQVSGTCGANSDLTWGLSHCCYTAISCDVLQDHSETQS